MIFSSRVHFFRQVRTESAPQRANNSQSWPVYAAKSRSALSMHSSFRRTQCALWMGGKRAEEGGGGLNAISYSFRPRIISKIFAASTASGSCASSPLSVSSCGS